MPSSLESVGRQFAIGVATVGQIVSIPQGPRTLLRILGWDTPPGADDIGLAALNVGDLASKLMALDLTASASAGSGGVTLDAQYADIFAALSKALSALGDLTSGFSAPADYLNKTQIEQQFLPRLFDFLVSTQLAAASPFGAMLAQFIGIMTLEQHDADAAVYQVVHLRPVIHWDRLGDVFAGPAGRIRAEYGWGTQNFDADRLIANIGALVELVGVPASFRALPTRVEAQLSGGVAPPPGAVALKQVLYSFIKGADVTGLDVGVSLYPLRTSAAGSDGGLGISPYLRGTADTTVALSDHLSVEVDASVDLHSGIAVQLRPGQAPAITSGLMAGPLSTTTSGHAMIGLKYADPTGGLVTLLSVDGGIGLLAQSLSFGGGADVSGGVVGVIVRARLTGGHFQLDTSKTDSFLATLIPLDLDLGFDLGVGWSSAYGFFIEGNASPQIDLGVHQSIGPFQLDTLHVGLTLGKPDLPLEVSLTGKGSLGPLEVVVQRLGITTDVKFQRGNLGPVDLSLGMKPPTGLGIRIDAGLISGGGFLMFDPDNHRYAGVLDCTIVDLVQVKIIGVLDTVMPDGSTGFSFLLIITFQFPPIQLGFGFTLSGVGGVGGVNRSMSFDALRAGLRAHTLDSVLFPADPVGNAPRIISDIESYFPVASGRYVFGPMFQISWGTPSLISLSIGIILEVPDPVRMAILGQITSELPTEDFALIEIHIDVLGTVDFGQQQLAIDGEMYQSRLVVYSLSGGMALRLNWGSNPNFAYSVGGLNPRFQPPPGFPKLARMSVSIGFGDNPRLSSNSYLAVTSNSVQFGANVELYAAAAGFSVHGYVGFDALFIFSPFSFAIDFAAGVDVQFEGVSLVSIHLDASLSGPRPWHIYGHASFSILFFDVSATLDLQWGDTAPFTLPSAPVLPDLTKALEDPRAWSTLMPEGTAQFVSLAPRPNGDKALVVHPVGALQVKEKVVPLDQKITKYGNYAPADGDLFSIAGVTVDGQTQMVQSQSDYFAIGQFTSLTDADKVSAPSYQHFHSGVTVGSNAVESGQEVVLDVKYEESYIDNEDEVSRFSRIYALPLDVHLAMCRKGAGFVNALAGNGIAKFTTPGSTSPVVVADTVYVIASTEDLSARSDLTPQPVTQYEASTLLQSHLASNPAQRGALQVLPAHEAAA